MGLGLNSVETAPLPPLTLAPFGLIRTPILRPSEATTAAWNGLRAAQARRTVHDAWVVRLTPAAIARLTAALAMADPATHGALIDVRRALHNGRRPSQGALRRAGRGAIVIKRSLRRRDRIDAAIAAAWTTGHAIERESVRALLGRRTFHDAIALAAPDLIAQCATARGKRARMTTRTLLRLAWRAAGRAAPMGGFATTALMFDEIAHAAGSVLRAGAEHFVTTHVRRDALPVLVHELDDPPLLDCEMVERRLWRAAMLDLTLLPDAARATHWRKTAASVGQGGVVPALDRRDARSLWFERLDREPRVLDPTDIGPALATLARFGSDRVAREPRATSAQLLMIMELAGQSGQAGFTAFARHAEAALVALHDAPTVSALPLEVLLNGAADANGRAAAGVVDRALSAGGTITAEEADALSLPAERPLRAACRLRAAGNGRARLTHWGGDAMTVLAPYRDAAGAIDARCAARLDDWAARWPGAADVALDALAAAGRQHRFAPRRIVHRASAAGEIGIETLTVAWRDGTVTISPAAGGAIDQAIHPGVAVERATGFASRLLVALCRAPPTPIELLLAALNRRLATDIATWLARTDSKMVLALPELNLDAKFVLAPAAWCLRVPQGNVADVWAALAAAGMPLGLAECRFPGVLGEPRIVDLASPDGVGLLSANGAAFAHLTPLGKDQVIEYCIELTAERPS